RYLIVTGVQTCALPIYELQLGREAVGDLARAVGGAVVDHQYAVPRAKHVAQRQQHRLEIRSFVVRRKADGRAHRRAYDRWRGRKIGRASGRERGSWVVG